jgi:hypothetical protein
MPNIICKKCGLTGWSKCPYCRSVFADRDYKVDDCQVGMLDGIFSHYIVLNDPTLIKFRVLRDEGWENALLRVRDLLADVPDAAIKVLACPHEWEFQPGTCSEIDCGHKYEEVKEAKDEEVQA